jgi:hypothetical protein
MIKIIALITMLIDHTGIIIFTQFELENSDEKKKENVNLKNEFTMETKKNYVCPNMLLFKEH